MIVCASIVGYKGRKQDASESDGQVKMQVSEKGLFRSSTHFR